MVISLRHFVITIASIFLSLGIGIFLGAIMDSQQLFIEQQKVLVAQIEKEFNDYKQKNFELMNKLESFEKERDKYKEFLNSIYDYLIKERVRNLNVLLVHISKKQDYSDVIDLLKYSGANKVIQISIDDFSKANIDEVKWNIENEFRNEDNNYSEENIFSYIDYVIIANGISNKNVKEIGQIKNNLLEEIMKLNIPIMAIEKSNSNFSFITFFKEIGLSTVDNVDTKIGKISMLMVISGRTGHFGEKETADKLIPEGFLVYE